MNKILRILRVLVTGSFTMLLSACYGVLIPFEKSFRVKNINDEVIPELKISYKNIDDNTWLLSGYTDSNGEFIFSDMNYGGNSFLYKIEDIDGLENKGEYKTKILSDRDETNNVILDEK